MNEAQVLTQGWMGDKRQDQRRYHYINETRSLCGRLGFYTGMLVAATDPLGDKPLRDDCAECFKRLKRMRGAAR